MPVESEDLEALRAAVAAAPRDDSLRLKLAALLLKHELPHVAWHHCTKVLAERPESRRALKLALQAATACGASYRAEIYAEELARLEGQRTFRRSEGDPKSEDRIYKVKGRSLRVIRGGADDRRSKG